MEDRESPIDPDEREKWTAPEIPIRPPDQFDVQVRDGLEKLYDECETNDQRVDRLMAELNGKMPENITDDVKESMRTQLEACRDIQLPEEFVQQALRALQPFIDYNRVSTPDRQALLRRTFREQKKYEPLDGEGILVYGRTPDGRFVHIHLAPAQDKNVLSLRHIVRSGLRELARRIEEQPEEWKSLESITATSWIVARHADLIKRLGFTVEEAVDEDVRERHFKYETRQIGEARMSKTDLLRKFGSESM